MWTDLLVAVLLLGFLVALRWLGRRAWHQAYAHPPSLPNRSHQWANRAAYERHAEHHPRVVSARFSRNARRKTDS